MWISGNASTTIHRTLSFLETIGQGRPEGSRNIHRRKCDLEIIQGRSIRVYPKVPYFVSFYYSIVGKTAAATLSDAEAFRQGREVESVFKIVYWNMVRAESQHWLSYWERRLNQRGLDPAIVRSSLLSLPRAVSQGERWQCLRMHMNAVPARCWANA